MRPALDLRNAHAAVEMAGGYLVPDRCDRFARGGFVLIEYWQPETVAAVSRSARKYEAHSIDW